MVAFPNKVIIRKAVKIVCLIILLWVLSIVFFVRKMKFVNKIIKDENLKFKRVFYALKHKIDGMPPKIGITKSDFKVWQMVPVVNTEMSLEEKYSIVKGYDTTPGEDGKPVILNHNLKLHTRVHIKKGWNEHSFNSFVSDLIPYNRSLPDPRDDWCKKNFTNQLLKATVVICFHNEAWSTLLRTLHSVLNRSPENLLEEVILVDDASTMEQLKIPLDKYITTLPKVKLFQTNYREGLIRTRILGTKRAKAPIVVFLDSHCECAKGWLEPLLERITENPTRVVSPVVDTIHDSTFEYINQDVYDLRIGGFTWDLRFQWIVIPHDILAKRTDEAAPIQTPTISGGLFAIDKKYFEKLGFYDEKFDIWGAENLELSFKTWMCGGSLEIVPCSHVGHVFRNRFPYKGIKGSDKRNSVRLAEVWLDDYAKYYYARIGNNKGNFGDVSSRKELREKLKCKSFKWYLDTVYPQMILPDNRVASGQIASLNYDDYCLDGIVKFKHLRESINLVPCHHSGGNQFWEYTKYGEIRRDYSCLDYMYKSVIIYPCRGKTSSQIWLYNEKTRSIKHTSTGLCLTASSYREKYKITLLQCIKAPCQMWAMENLVINRLLPEIQNCSKCMPSSNLGSKVSKHS